MRTTTLTEEEITVPCNCRTGSAPKTLSAEIVSSAMGKSGDERRPLTGVFYTRSPARPDPLKLHPVTVHEIEGTRVKIGPDRGIRRHASGRHQVSVDT